MAYKVIILYQLYMPSYFLGTFTEYPEESIGYRAFFVWIMLCTIPSFWATHLVRKNLTDNHSDNSSR